MNQLLTKPARKSSVQFFTSDDTGMDIAAMNRSIRQILGYGLVHDVKRPLDLAALRADYRNHKIKLLSGGQIERFITPPALHNFYVPVLISRTLADPLKPSRAIQFYVKVKADDTIMAAHLAGSIVRHQWATPRHSINVSIAGVVEL